MSWTALLEFEAARAEEGTPEPPLEWLLAMLKQVMEETMAGEATPLQKANAIARLGNLYLKTYRAAELTKENKALTRRVAELEEKLQRAGGPVAPPDTGPAPAPRPHEPEPDAMPVGRAPIEHPAESGRQPAFAHAGGSQPVTGRCAPAPPRSPAEPPDFHPATLECGGLTPLCSPARPLREVAERETSPVWSAGVPPGRLLPLSSPAGAENGDADVQPGFLGLQRLIGRGRERKAVSSHRTPKRPRRH